MHTYPYNVLIHCPVLAFSYSYAMKIGSVIFYKTKTCSVCKFQNNIYEGVKNGMLYSQNTKIINMSINYLCNWQETLSSPEPFEK